MATGDKLVNLEVLKETVQKEVVDLKSIITQPTRNLVAGVIREASINADNASGIIAANASYDMYYAPVESGKTYYVNTNDSSGLVYGYYSSIPATGSTATAVGGHYRFIDGTNKYFTSQATGYVAFRTAANFAYAQIEEGSVFSGYIAPLSAVDAVIREETYEEAVFTTTADRILKTDGIEATASGWTRSNAIDVTGTAYVLISGTFNLLTPSSGHTHVLFKSWEDVSATDTSKTYLVKQINLAPTAMAYLSNYMVAVPVGAKYMYICSSTANFGTVSVKKYYDPSSKTKQINISTAQQLYDFLKNPVRNAEVTIEPGSYELYTNLFATDIGNDTDFPITSYMQDVTIHGNNATISFTVPDNVVSAKASVVNTYSILNFIGSCHVYDLTLNAYNLRYALHIESSTYESAWYSEYVFENCKFIYADNAGAVSLNRNAVGIGGSKGQHYVFKNCYIEDSTFVHTFYIHTRTYNMSELLIDNCVFSNKSNGYGLLLSQYTGNGKPVDVNIVNSVIGKIYMKTQSGGETNNQYRIVAVNSYIPDIIVDENTTLLFNPKRANAITGDIDTTHN